MLVIISSAMIYTPFWVLTSKEHLIPGTREYKEDVVMLILAICLALGSIYAWKRVIVQFKCDRTVLGFSPDANGVSVTVQALIGAAITFFGIIYLG